MSDVSLDFYAELDAHVDNAENDGIQARWQFGRTLLMERIGKQLPAGRIDEIAEKVGKSPTELRYRMRFAERYPTEIEVSNAIADFRSWFGIVNGALASTAHLSAEKDEWATPDELFELLDAEFHFTIDLCAHAKNAKCDRWFGPGGIAENGLTESWTDEIGFMNPPYSEIEDWIAKAHDESPLATIVCLVPSRTDVRWFWDFARWGEIRFLQGRLRFVDDDGNTGPAPFPSAIVVFAPDRRTGVVWYEP